MSIVCSDVDTLSEISKKNFVGLVGPLDREMNTEYGKESRFLWRNCMEIEMQI